MKKKLISFDSKGIHFPRWPRFDAWLTLWWPVLAVIFLLIFLICASYLPQP